MESQPPSAVRYAWAMCVIDDVVMTSIVVRVCAQA